MNLWWSEERLGRLSALWAQGLSAAKIAKELGEGLTRNAVIGALNRNGMKRLVPDPIVRERVGRPPKPRNTNPLGGNGTYRRGGAKKVTKPKLKAIEPEPVQIPNLPRPWITRKAFECAFPVGGEGADTLSCCNPCPGARYCADHAAIMFGPPGLEGSKLMRSLKRWAA